MKSTDNFSKKIITISLCLSLLMLSASALVFSLSFIAKAQAEPAAARSSLPWQNLEGAVGLGIVNNTGYFVVWSSSNKLYKVDLSKATDWYSE